MNESVSPQLYDTIKELMQMPSLKDFLLGGGTSLAIKHNYRISTDIDLFSPEQVTVTELFLIKKTLENHFGPKAILELKNKESKYASFLTGYLDNIKIDIIHNIPFNHSMDMVNDIRLVNDLDIGALKLISASNRGSRKDFYDLYFLSEKLSLETLFNEYIRRVDIFSGDEFQNLFNIANNGRMPSLLHKDCSPLGDFTNANLTQNNKILFPETSIFNKLTWFDVRERWKNKIVDFAEKRNISFKETPNQRKLRFKL